jgi:dolichyl-phosphate beta-glucosyltransferase
VTEDWRPPLGLVVPVFDEAIRLDDYGKLLVDFVAQQPVGSELVFVDDGSTDGTAERIVELLANLPGAPARVLRRPHAGKGAAVTAGLRSLDAPLLAYCDLDLSTPLDDLDRIASAAARAGAVAVGSRDLMGSTLVKPQGHVREALGRVYNRLLQVAVTPGVVDTQCGAKAAPRRVWEAVLPHCHEVGFAWDAEVIAVAQALGIEVLEVPVSWRHDDRSKINVGRDGLAMVAATPRIWRSARQATGASRSRTTASAAVVGRAPAPAHSATDHWTEVYDDANARLLAATDRSHWWYRSKAALVATALRRTARPVAGWGWLVDIGAGSGGVTKMLGWSPDRVVLVEGNQALATQARGRHGFTVLQASVHHVPLADATADVVCLLDVIEHLHDPAAALREAARLLAPGGRLVVNVPAHAWLWSAFDEEVGHLRRYTCPALRAELDAADLEPVLLSHVFCWLALPMWVKRSVMSGGVAEFGFDQTSLVIDRVALALTFGERALLGRVTLPLGSSVLCVATRRR